MKLSNKKEYISSNYICELTKELDVLANLEKREHYDWFYHYIVADNYCKQHK